MMTRNSESLTVISEPGFSIITMRGIPIPLDSATINRIYELLIAHDISASFGHLRSLPYSNRSNLSLVVPDANLFAAKEILRPWVESLSAKTLTTRSNLTRLSIEDSQATNLISLANSVVNVLAEQGIELLSFTATGRSVFCLIENKGTQSIVQALSDILCE